MVVPVRAKMMLEVLFQAAKQSQHNQAEHGGNEGHRNLTQPGSRASRGCHPDSRRGGQSMHFPSVRELENRTTAQKPDARHDPLNHAPQGFSLHTAFSS